MDTVENSLPLMTSVKLVLGRNDSKEYAEFDEKISSQDIGVLNVIVLCV